MKSKRGQGLPMNTIVIAAIVLIVMVVLIMIFSGSMGTWLTSLKNETEGKTCESYRGTGTDAASIGHWVNGPMCTEAGEVPVYNTQNADTHPGQTCCVKK
ncbi:hypothetical protein COY26_04725 [Candidatus Woesearchaeota archaeon CG_4_10_14_0_2_um_filter_33_10]|nr:MAG: hypothetical protein AUJ83_04800 [Candidatus Woesearchaeota archaeon CG1_02_33_12]PIN78574.1 MAG: hypothetical protein COV14_02930 [Candidatus Woesearchaeota archaeon CG10_big_fil_rev_8_21_14_0_10_33_12]PIU72452.1 MAG: hypothetical protein COS79_02835 [Candidatus Woesearchaeota archaeon CG06_land_8_20_14_3_00_33_13]PIZ52361.1 MAG: hypothetical protein COY26_04725 [Candidatus Woesearchaeota archaeon CG_4_10_14_0_2_um_filter_33_10]